MRCGTSSLLIQVTLVPAFTVSVGGVKLKLSMPISFGAEWCGRACRLAFHHRLMRGVLERRRQAGQRGVDDGERAATRNERHVRDAEHALELFRIDLHRTRGGCGARCGLRKGGRHRGVKRHVALHLLHDLVNVAVQHGHRSEALEETERLLGVVRAPAPLRIDGPQRHVREEHDRRAARRDRRHPSSATRSARRRATRVRRP